MGKKRCRSSYTSKGERRNVAKSTVRLMREGVSNFQKEYNKLQAWKKGLNPWITVPGPGSNMRFVRRRANDVWGDPKRISMFYGDEN